MPELAFEPLPRTFYRPSARAVAEKLLGHFLIRRTKEGYSGGLIVETEAYLADDPACHGAAGLTARNRSMFGPPGHAYVYLIYGLHFCVNAVCRPVQVAEAVLIRAIEPIFGEGNMRQWRSAKFPRELTNGPAKLCQALEIDRSLDGIDLCDNESALFIAKNPRRAGDLRRLGPMASTPRIGITRAATLALRFYWAKSPCLSRRHKT
jgi:DNA-3-methyladenine glycosylase